MSANFRTSKPSGWDEQRVHETIAHYDSQTEDEQSRRAEIEAAHEAKGVTFVAAPNELLLEVQALLARRQSA